MFYYGLSTAVLVCVCTRVCGWLDGEGRMVKLKEEEAVMRTSRALFTSRLFDKGEKTGWRLSAYLFFVKNPKL